MVVHPEPPEPSRSAPVASRRRHSAFASRLRRVLASVELLGAIVGLGVVLRVAQYLSGRSLWLDEALLGLNIIERSPGELLQTLDFNQAAPPGFLLLENGVAALFGHSEAALRVIPLLAGIGSVLIFAWLARRILTPLPALLAVFLFSVSDGLIYYASEVKPYSLDVLATLLLLTAATLLIHDCPSRRVAAVMGVLGMGLMTVSYAAVLMCVAIGFVFLLLSARESRATNITRVIPLVLWSSGAIAIGVLASTSTNGIRASFTRGTSSATFDPAIRLESLIHQVNVLGTDLLGTIGFFEGSPWNHLYKVAAFGFALGAAGLAGRDPRQLALLLIPIGIALLAWSLGQYPLLPRTILFLIPIVLLLLGQGVATAATLISSRWRPIAALIAVGVLIGPVWTAAQSLIEPRTNEELRPVLAYVQDHWQRGDTIYIHYAAQYAWRYYAECDCIAEAENDKLAWRYSARRGREQFSPALEPLSANVLVGSAGNSAHQLQDLERLRMKKRAWFLYTHVAQSTEEAFIRQQLIGRLEELGTRVAEINRFGAHAYLYELG